MKIAIPAENRNIDSNVCASFGRAPYFLIYDIETKESTFKENTAAASTGGAGIKAAQIIVDEKVNALLTVQLGENAAKVLKGADVRIYKAIDASIKENIESFAADKLALLTQIHAGYHGRGNR